MSDLDKYAGIMTAATAPYVSGEEVWANVLAAYDRLRDMPPVARKCECGSDVPAALRSRLPVEPTHTDPLTAFFGIPIVVDDRMPPDRWRLVDADGNILGEGSLPAE